MPLFGLWAWCLFLSLGVFLPVLGMEPRASCLLNKCSNILPGRWLFLVQRSLISVWTWKSQHLKRRQAFIFWNVKLSAVDEYLTGWHSAPVTCQWLLRIHQGVMPQEEKLGLSPPPSPPPPPTYIRGCTRTGPWSLLRSRVAFAFETQSPFQVFTSKDEGA